jgi:hypothetical protein
MRTCARPRGTSRRVPCEYPVSCTLPPKPGAACGTAATLRVGTVPWAVTEHGTLVRRPVSFALAAGGAPRPADTYSTVPVEEHCSCCAPYGTPRRGPHVSPTARRVDDATRADATRNDATRADAKRNDARRGDSFRTHVADCAMSPARPPQHSRTGIGIACMPPARPRPLSGTVPRAAVRTTRHSRRTEQCHRTLQQYSPHGHGARGHSGHSSA